MSSFLFNEQIINDVKKHKVLALVMDDGTRIRPFLSKGGVLCRKAHGRRNYGYPMSGDELRRVKQIKYRPKPKTVDEINFQLVMKYRKLALTSELTNHFITACQNLPETHGQWIKEGRKSLYDYGITTGNSIEGKVIGVESLFKAFSNYEKKRFEQAIKTRTEYMSPRLPYRGYEATVTVYGDKNKGITYSSLSMEYKNCLNGYYYLLINNEKFIGYDVD